MPEKSNWRVWLFGLLSVIMLGAISNGVWELAFKPAGMRAIDLVMKSPEYVLNDVIAKAKITPAAMVAGLIYDTMLIASVGSLLGIVAIWICSKPKLSWAGTVDRWFGFPTPEQEAATAKEITRLQNELTNVNASAEISQLKSAEDQKIRSALKRLVRASLALLVTVLLWLSYIAFVNSVALSLSQTFESNFAACAPHLTESERLELKAKFAKMQHAAEYLTLMNKLQVVATKNEIELPYPIRN